MREQGQGQPGLFETPSQRKLFKKEKRKKENEDELRKSLFSERTKKKHAAQNGHPGKPEAGSAGTCGQGPCCRQTQGGKTTTCLSHDMPCSAVPKYSHSPLITPGLTQYTRLKPYFKAQIAYILILETKRKSKDTHRERNFLQIV